MNIETNTPSAFLDSLDPSEARELRARGVARTFPRGTALFHQDQLCDRAIVLLSGYVKLSAMGEDGREVVLAIRGPGDLIGELGVLDGRPRSATAITLEPVSALAISAADFR